VTYTPLKACFEIAWADEDVDGFLWIQNVLSSAERRAILIQYNSGKEPTRRVRS
jgi:hypothetical protein